MMPVRLEPAAPWSGLGLALVWSQALALPLYICVHLMKISLCKHFVPRSGPTVSVQVSIGTRGQFLLYGPLASSILCVCMQAVKALGSPVHIQGSYRQVCVKFKDFLRTSKTFLLFSRTENL